MKESTNKEKPTYLVIESESGLTPEDEKKLAKAAMQARSIFPEETDTDANKE